MDTRRSLRWTLALVLLLASAVPAAAQDADPPARDGFWGSLGFGASPLGCFDGCNSGMLWGVGGSLKLGGTINPDLLIGYAGKSWYREQVTFSLSSILVQIYPGDSDFWLNFGAGVANAFADFYESIEWGAGGVVGLGYDIRLGAGSNWSLSPYTDFMVATLDGVPYTIQLGMAITLH